MSDLGNLIVEVGPFAEGEVLGGLGWALHDVAKLNALRDELIELRAQASGYPWVLETHTDQPCPDCGLALTRGQATRRPELGRPPRHLVCPDGSGPAAGRISPLPAQDPSPVPTATPEGATAVSAGAECRAETHSWAHFTPDQTDSYWIRCTLSGPHDEHEDANTGLTWRTEGDA